MRSQTENNGDEVMRRLIIDDHQSFYEGYAWTRNIPQELILYSSVGCFDKILSHSPCTYRSLSLSLALKLSSSNTQLLSHPSLTSN